MRPPSTRRSSRRGASSASPAAKPISTGGRRHSTRRVSTQRVSSLRTARSSSPKTRIEIHPPPLNDEDTYEVLDLPPTAIPISENTEFERPSTASDYVNNASDVSMDDTSSVEESEPRSDQASVPLKRGGRSMPLRLLPRRQSNRVDRSTSSRSNNRLRTRRQSQRQASRSTGAITKQYANGSAGPGSDSSDDVLIQTRQTKPATKRRKRSSLASVASADPSEDQHRRKSARQRNVKYNDLTEPRLAETDISDESDTSTETASGVTTQGVKPAHAKESFKAFEAGDPFLARHQSWCASCSGRDGAQKKGAMVFCQGCTNSYHAPCLGPRRHRDHLVTRVGEDEFVLQCRYCIGFVHQKNFLAPHYGRCTVTKELAPFSLPLRTPGNDTIDSVFPAEHLYNPDSLMFRCQKCDRAWKMSKLPSLKQRPSSQGSNSREPDVVDDATIAEERFKEYSKQWSCLECLESPEAQTIVAWRPTGSQKDATLSIDVVPETEREYLIKWKEMSYLNVTWMPGSWVFGSLSHIMRQSFIRKEPAPKFNTEDAFPPGYLHVDVVLDVQFNHKVRARDSSYQADLARIDDVKEIYTKFQGLPYEDCVWQKPPSRKETEKWASFEKAYKIWALGNWIQPPEKTSLTRYLKEIRKLNFKKNFLKEEQPSSLTGGKLMEYQLDGLNWIYYQWFIKRNAVLADEMGLGKTIQVIAFISTLIEDHKCFPFLIVAPNSTCANWRREFNTWAPSIRTVTYYGSAKSRQLVHDYELFMKGDNQLNCHVVITSYEAAVDSTTKRVFSKTPWAGLIVDEGQRLKSDKNQLYTALRAMNFPFKLLLTGTPLQNNVRELFNVLSFCDPTIDPEEMEEKYEEITKENIGELHEMIRPYFLRRTKAQALKFLPPMAQMIIPLSMTVLQKKLSKSILAKNPDLIRSIFDPNKTLAATERHNLNNILMQLRKCLCHPFIYNRDIEDQSVSAQEGHRNLIDASAKLKLLELLLPKLKERGHRVLLFSQFLDNLNIIEDFLDILGLKYCRLDGSKSALERQKDMDDFNAEDSPYFAFLLSTRAGGIGINLASADTVIIMDPDFNPHQDIQALSRAHRIGQQKKVLVFQLMTRGSAEEKIMQIGKQKMALDHVLIQRMDADDEEDVDVETILRHGADDIFGDNTDNDIHYDNKAIDRLLDRSHIESTQKSDDTENPESQFSFAKVWMHNSGQFEDTLGDADADTPVDAGAWEKILQERERAAEEAAKLRAEALGRGKRKRQAVNYKMGGYSPGRSSRKGVPSSPDAEFRDDGQSSTGSSDADSAATEPLVPGNDPFSISQPAPKPGTEPQTSSHGVTQPVPQMSIPAPLHPHPQTSQIEVLGPTQHAHPTHPNGQQVPPAYGQFVPDPTRVAQTPQLQQVPSGQPAQAAYQHSQSTQAIPPVGSAHTAPQPSINPQHVPVSKSPQITSQFPQTFQQNPGRASPYYYPNAPSPFGNQQFYPIQPQASPQAPPQYFMPGAPMQRQESQTTSLQGPPAQPSHLLQQLQGVSRTNTPFSGPSPSTVKPYPIPSSTPAPANFPHQPGEATPTTRLSDNANKPASVPHSGSRPAPLSPPMPISFSQQLQDISAAYSAKAPPTGPSQPAGPALPTTSTAPHRGIASAAPPSGVRTSGFAQPPPPSSTLTHPSASTSNQAPSPAVTPAVAPSVPPASSGARLQATASSTPPVGGATSPAVRQSFSLNTAPSVPGPAPTKAVSSPMPPPTVSGASGTPRPTSTSRTPSSSGPALPGLRPPASSSATPSAAPGSSAALAPAASTVGISAGPTPAQRQPPSAASVSGPRSAAATPPNILPSTVAAPRSTPSQAVAPVAPSPVAPVTMGMPPQITAAVTPPLAAPRPTHAQPPQTAAPRIAPSVVPTSGTRPKSAVPPPAGSSATAVSRRAKSSTMPPPQSSAASPTPMEAVASAISSLVAPISAGLQAQAPASNAPPAVTSASPVPRQVVSSTLPPSAVSGPSPSPAPPRAIAPAMAPTATMTPHAAPGPRHPPLLPAAPRIAPSGPPAPSGAQSQSTVSGTSSAGVSASPVPRQATSSTVPAPPVSAVSPAPPATLAPAMPASASPASAGVQSRPTASTAPAGNLTFPAPRQSTSSAMPPQTVSAASPAVSQTVAPSRPSSVTPVPAGVQPHTVVSTTTSSASVFSRPTPAPSSVPSATQAPPAAATSGPAPLPVVASTMSPPPIPPPTATGNTSHAPPQPFVPAGAPATAPASMFSRFRAVNNQPPPTYSNPSPSATGNNPAASPPATSAAPVSSAPTRPPNGSNSSTTAQPPSSLSSRAAPSPAPASTPPVGNASATTTQPCPPQSTPAFSLPLQPTAGSNQSNPIQAPSTQGTPAAAPRPAEGTSTSKPPDTTMAGSAPPPYSMAVTAPVGGGNQSEKQSDRENVQ